MPESVVRAPRAMSLSKLLVFGLLALGMARPAGAQPLSSPRLSRAPVGTPPTAPGAAAAKTPAAAHAA